MTMSFVDDHRTVRLGYDSLILPGFEEIYVGDAITLVADNEDGTELAVRLEGESVVLWIDSCCIEGEIVEFSGSSVTVEIKSIIDTEADSGY